MQSPPDPLYLALALSSLATLYHNLMTYNGPLYRWKLLLIQLLEAGKPFDDQTGGAKYRFTLRPWGRVYVYGWQYYLGMVLGGCVPCSSFWVALALSFWLPAPTYAALGFAPLVYLLTTFFLSKFGE